MKKIIGIVLFFCSLPFLAQEYAVTSIDSDILDHSNSVLRMEEKTIDLLKVDKMKTSYQRVVTVLNKAGDKDVDALVFYRNDHVIKKLKARILDEKGEEIKKFKKKDFKDLSAVGSSSLYTDSRYFSLDYTPRNYPYTVIFEYESVNKNTTHIPAWNPIANFNQAVEKSVYEINDEAALGLRYKAVNTEEVQGVVIKESAQQLKFEATNLKALKAEYRMPTPDYFSPHILVRTKQFSLHGEKTDTAVENWNDFGTWYYANLVEGRNTVSEKTAQEILNLVAGVDDPKERAKLVYEYVQSQVRYINIAIGIGGWQPADAQQVDELKYGDCKGLSNYTQALLKLADVEAYWTVLYSSYKPKDLHQDFPSLQGNHMILNVPLEEEDLWLECTSSYLPFGYVGASNQGRKVLVVGENGGEIKEIKAYQNDLNFQYNVAEINLHNNGNMVAKLHKKSTGTQYDSRYGYEVVAAKEAKNKYLSDWAALPKLDILNFDFENDRNALAFHEHIELMSRGFSKQLGNRLMFKVNPLNTFLNVPRKYKERKNPFDLGNGFVDEDHYVFNLPPNFTVEALPENISFSSPYGKYSLELEAENDQLRVQRRFQLNAGLFPKEEYDAYRDFLIDVAKYDESKAVISPSKT